MTTCKHEMNETTLKYDKKYGRTGVCKHCGVRLVGSRFIKMNKSNRPNRKTRRKNKEL